MRLSLQSSCNSPAVVHISTQTRSLCDQKGHQTTTYIYEEKDHTLIQKPSKMDADNSHLQKRGGETIAYLISVVAKNFS